LICGPTNKIRLTHDALVYRTREIQKIFESIERGDIHEYLNEWDNGLREQMEADEDIIINNDEDGDISEEDVADDHDLFF
jgi:hypothetical protein